MIVLRTLLKFSNDIVLGNMALVLLCKISNEKLKRASQIQATEGTVGSSISDVKSH